MTEISAKAVAHSLNTSVKDSSKRYGHPEIITMEVVMPRMILAEAKTHRLLSGIGEQVEITQSLGFNDEFDFSRNSASSRAIPFNKMLEMVNTDPFVPIAWQKDHKGMQGTSYITDERAIQIREVQWGAAKTQAVKAALDLNAEYTFEDGDSVTKQLCNRLLEPFMWHKVLVTATELDNFFSLRCPKYVVNGKEFRSKKEVLAYTNMILGESDYDGYTTLDWLKINKGQSEIHMMMLAEAMWDVYKESVPKKLKEGDWHIPYGDNIDIDALYDYYINVLLSTEENKARGAWVIPEKEWFKQLDVFIDLIIKVATARSARVSYTTVGDNKEFKLENDIRLHDVLLESGHFSPFEHIAKVMSADEYFSFFKGKFNAESIDISMYGWCNNFKGFEQYRYMLENK